MEINKIRLFGIITLVAAIIISEIIANLPGKHETGLFGVSQIFAPILIGVISIVVFVLLSLLFKNKFFLWCVVIITSIYIIYVGLDLHYKF